MKEKLNGFMEKLKTGWGKVGKKNQIRLGAVLGILVVGAVILAMVLRNQPYTVLFTGLSAEEASSIMTYLDQNGASDYRLEDNDTILVQKGQEAQLKAKLLMEGYPKSGFAYDTYLKNVGSLSTESDRQTAFLFDLQDRMGSVIRCLDGVKNAWVTIAQGEDRRYVLDSSNMVEASASVLVEMAGGQKLTGQQAAAIRNLVARAVKGLNIENISISDTIGNTYSNGDGAPETGDASHLKLALEEQVNNSVRTSVMQVLTPFFGEDNVCVSIKSTVDVSHSVGNTTTYTQPDWAADGSTGGKGIIGSRIYDNVIDRSGEGQTAGGVVGAETNSDLETYVENQAAPDGTEDTIHTSGQVDYNVNTQQEKLERTAGVVTDLMVSVSINSEAVSNVNEDTLLGHVARAAGIGAQLQNEKISIVTMPFYEEPDNGILPGEPILPEWSIYAAIGGVVLLLLILLLVAILRRRKKKKQEQPVPMGVPYEEPEPVTMGADIMNMRSEKSMEYRKAIREFADSNPEIAAQMVKNWLREGDDADG